MSSHGSLDAAAQDRKARLAQLKSLKRKKPGEDATREIEDAGSTTLTKAKSPSPEKSVTATYISGRNYDAETRGPRLGFEISPAANVVTLEQQAEELSIEVRAQAAKEESEDKPLDLFKLQPKKPNWDLKRELDKKLEVLNVRTDNAIARLVRERIESAKKDKEKEAVARGGRNGTDKESEEVGMEGQALVEAMHLREIEDEAEAKREREEEDEV
jgi:coiled-coil domain-containing protein 12